MKFTLARMLRCEWGEIVKNRFCSSLQIRTISQIANQHKKRSEFFCPSSPSIWICQRQISKTISKTANPYIKEKKHRELFSPSIWNPADLILGINQRKTKHPKNIETYQARTLKPKYANTKYIFRAEMPKQLVILSSIFWRTQKAFTDNCKFYCSCCELYIHSCEVSFCRGKRLRPTSKYLLWNFQESYLALVRTSEDERIALKEIGN